MQVKTLLLSPSTHSTELNFNLSLCFIESAMTDNQNQLLRLLTILLKVIGQEVVGNRHREGAVSTISYPIGLTDSTIWHSYCYLQLKTKHNITKHTNKKSSVGPQVCMMSKKFQYAQVISISGQFFLHGVIDPLKNVVFMIFIIMYFEFHTKIKRKETSLLTFHFLTSAILRGLIY